MVFLPADHLLCEHQYNGTDWDDITGSLVSVALTLREFSGTHTASVVLYDDTIDPAQGTGTHVLKEGDKVRMFAENSSSTSRKMATFTIKKVTTDIDLAKPPGLTHRVTMTLRGAGVAGVGGIGASSGTDDLTELSNVITGAAFEINGDGFGSGQTTPTGTLTESAVINEASELDQITLTRDSNPSTVVFEDPDGTLQIFDADTYRTGAAAWTIGPDNYSHIEMRGVDTSHVINVLTIRYVQKVKTGAGHTRKVEHDVVFVDSASKAKYGPHKKTVTIHHKTDFAAYAADVFARNADPDPVPTSVTIPVRAASELLPGYADGAYVGGKVDVTAPDGVTTYTCRVARIRHDITQRRWLVTVDLRNVSVVQRPRPRASAVSTEVSNNPDGTILTAAIDDQAVTGDKLEDTAVDGKTVTAAVFQTATSGQRMVLSDDTSGGVIQYFTGAGAETLPGSINPKDLSGTPVLVLTSPKTSDATAITLKPTLVDVTGPITCSGAATVSSGGINVTGGLTSVGGYSIAGGGSVNGAMTNNGGIAITGASNTVNIASPPTTTNAANVRISPGGGNIVISTSLRRHKLHREPITLAEASGLLEVTPQTWIDRAEWSANGRSADGLRRIPGLVAEDVADHAPVFATYTDAGDLQGVTYDRLAAGLLVILGDQADRLACQAAQLADLTTRLTALEAQQEGTR